MMSHWFLLRIKSFRYAFIGVGYLFVRQVNIWIHLVAAVLAVSLGMFFSLTGGEWIAITISIVSVLAAEAFNTAIEKLTDLVSPEFNTAAGQVKDMAAAAVLIMALGALVTGCIVFVPYINNLF